MAKLLHREGSFEVLSRSLLATGPEETNQIIELAGKTAYASHEWSRKDTDQFIESIKKKHHLAVLEHSRYAVNLLFRGDFNFLLTSMFYHLNRHFSITYDRPGLQNTMIVSGSARVWIEALYNLEFGPCHFGLPQIDGWQPLYVPDAFMGLIQNIAAILFDTNPVVFSKTPIETAARVSDISIRIALINKENYDQILSNDYLKYMHDGISVVFTNICRGFTHELVRHRTFAFLQRSTRYTSTVGKHTIPFSFILPYRDLSPEEIEECQKHADQIKDIYEHYRDERNWHPQEARQWLPIGIEAPIVTSGSDWSWKYFFKLRTDLKTVHPEMGFVANKLYDELVAFKPYLSIQ